MAMSVAASMQSTTVSAAVLQVNNSLIGSQAVASSSRPSSAVLLPSSPFLSGCSGCTQKSSAGRSGSSLQALHGKSRITCEAKAGSKQDKWSGLGYDTSDDQQDIQRGKGMVDALFQGAQGMGTQTPIMSSYDYISTAQRTFNFDNIQDGLYIAPAFMDKLVVHIAKNFMSLPNIKVLDDHIITLLLSHIIMMLQFGIEDCFSCL
jgi:hypothetical protein